MVDHLLSRCALMFLSVWFWFGCDRPTAITLLVAIAPAAPNNNNLDRGNNGHNHQRRDGNARCSSFTHIAPLLTSLTFYSCSNAVVSSSLWIWRRRWRLLLVVLLLLLLLLPVLFASFVRPSPSCLCAPCRVGNKRTILILLTINRQN